MADDSRRWLDRYPGWKDVKWSFADLKPGDCFLAADFLSRHVAVLLERWGLYIPYQWQGSLAQTSKVPWCLDVDVGLPRYHQVTAHPGRSINVHIWYGATAATAQRWEHEKVLESRAIRKENGTADWNVMEVESDEKSSIEHHTPQILKRYHHTFGIAPHWRRTDNLEVLASCQVRDKLWAGGCSCSEFFIPWGLSRNG